MALRGNNLSTKDTKTSQSSTAPIPIEAHTRSRSVDSCFRVSSLVPRLSTAVSRMQTVADVVSCEAELSSGFHSSRDLRGG